MQEIWVILSYHLFKFQNFSIITDSFVIYYYNVIGEPVLNSSPLSSAFLTKQRSSYEI